MKEGLFLLLRRAINDFGTMLSFLLLLIVLGVVFEGLSISLLFPLLHEIGIGSASHIGKLSNFLETVGNKFNIRNTTNLVFLIILASTILQFISNLSKSLLQAKINSQFISNIRKKIFTSIVSAKWSFFKENNASSLSNSIINESLRAGIAFDFVLQIVSVFVITSIYLLIAMIIDWKVTLLLTISGISISLLLYKQVKKGGATGTGISNNTEEILGWTNEVLANAKIIKANASEEHAKKYFYSINSTLEKLYAKAQYQPNFSKSIVEFFAFIGMISSLLVFTLYYPIDIAKLVIIFALFIRLYPKLSTFQYALQTLLINLPSINYIENIQNKANIEFESNFSNNLLESLELEFPPKITIEDLDIIYNDLIVIKESSLTIKPCKITVILGKSGSGKTSLLNCILKLIEPMKGQILINNTPTSNLTLNSLRKNIGYITQETLLFNTSIRENIIWDKIMTSDEEVLKCCELAGLTELIAKLPNGLEHQVGDQGLNLSGGERQRIAIARALIGNKKILIFDEATNALDKNTENKLLETIQRLKKHASIIFVTHHDSIIEIADNIYEISNNKILKKT